ncbi:helix-hairpin-helix domain-containing protein [Yoonia sp. 2307UL14-13]|uniref:helix-hairpin-helix domain-containing protein n=1 Tax=Yoonia sp. 2307UL14-13 TaxID=3126506 RepID=UPI0030B5907C
MIRIQTTDGQPIAFEPDHFAQGGMKNVHWVEGRRAVVGFYRNRPDPQGMERLQAIVGPHRKSILEGAGGETLAKLFRWPEALVEWNGTIGVVVPVFDGQFFFDHGSFDNDRLRIKGKEKEGKWFASAHNRHTFLDPREGGDWLGYLKICIRLARAVRRLHASGLAHSDLSYKNVLVDPLTGDACIIDIDGLVVPDKFPPEVVGTPDFVAPEVVATQHLPITDPRRKLPNMQTDLHALAVLIYMYLTLRHPLKGRKIHDTADSARDDMLSMGRQALFVEHPDDPSNRINTAHVRESELPWADTDKMPMSFCGPLITDLFQRAFINGLHDPAQRPRADDWELALVRTADMMLPCVDKRCTGKWFVFDNSTKPTCPFCATDYGQEVPVLNLYSSRSDGPFRPDNHRVTVYDGIGLYAWHANRFKSPNERLLPADRTRLAYFRRHDDQWFIVNEGLSGMKDITNDAPIPIGGNTILDDGAQILLDPAHGGRLLHVQLTQSVVSAP